jgi:hypothetical protein
MKQFESMTHADGSIVFCSSHRDMRLRAGYRSRQMFKMEPMMRHLWLRRERVSSSPVPTDILGVHWF